MSFSEAKAYLDARGFGERVIVLERSSATVQLAAEALGCAPNNIAKTLGFLIDGAGVLVVASGESRIDNSKFKATFHKKATMIPAADVLRITGHPMGGVCPFGVAAGCRVYLDASLRTIDPIYPACGSTNSAVRLSLADLEKVCEGAVWVDVCKKPAA